MNAKDYSIALWLILAWEFYGIDKPFGMFLFMVLVILSAVDAIMSIKRKK